jgi:phosphatidylinositol 4-kinase A
LIISTIHSLFKLEGLKYNFHLLFFFQATAFHSLLPAVRQKIIDSFTQDARDVFEREFDFFDKVTSISGVLFPLPKEERRAGIRR